MTLTRPARNDTLTPAARRSVIGGIVSLVVDSFDIYVPALVLPAAMNYFEPSSMSDTLKATMTSIVFTVTLLARPVGGVIFGNLGDKIGRKRITMIAGEFNTPSDWPRTGNAIATIDNFAATHGGSAPVFVFVDVGGSFNNDTECVNGPRGNVADHLTKDVPPYVTSTFGVNSANWGVLGWSMGGTCAVDLTVMHPELFSTFIDIAGDMGPNAGTKEQTIARIYGGDASKWPVYDPTTVINKHGPYKGISGWFAISSDPPTQRKGGYGNPNAVGLGGQDAAGNPGDQTDAANSLCRLGRANGIACAVVATPGKHDWPFAMDVFTSSLPWLAGQIGTPGVPRIPLPGGGAAPGPAGAPLQAATH